MSGFKYQLRWEGGEEMDFVYSSGDFRRIDSGGNVGEVVNFLPDFSVKLGRIYNHQNCVVGEQDLESAIFHWRRPVVVDNLGKVVLIMNHPPMPNVGNRLYVESVYDESLFDESKRFSLLSDLTGSKDGVGFVVVDTSSGELVERLEREIDGTKYSVGRKRIRGALIGILAGVLGRYEKGDVVVVRQEDDVVSHDDAVLWLRMKKALADIGGENSFYLYVDAHVSKNTHTSRKIGDIDVISVEQPEGGGRIIQPDFMQTFRYQEEGVEKETQFKHLNKLEEIFGLLS